MSNTLKQRYQQLQAQVKAAQDRLGEVERHLESAAVTPLATWDSLLKQVAANCEATRQPAQEASKRLSVWFEQSANLTPAPFDGSDLDGEMAKHEEEAAKLENLAADALVAAAQAVQEAELVVVSALKTRKQAIDLARFRGAF